MGAIRICGEKKKLMRHTSLSLPVSVSTSLCLVPTRGTEFQGGIFGRRALLLAFVSVLLSRAPRHLPHKH